MKIIKKPVINTVPFGKMKCGDVFSFSGLPYMRTEDLYSGNRTRLNIICLATGQAGVLSDNALVSPHPEAELHINE